jgi:demethylmenaquinone methyltransferase / 2-methoxy-6-polyprenyl-1,4-benzoquinol methylase
VSSSSPPAFAPVAHELRDQIIEHYERTGKPLDTPAGHLTLDTNSVLAASRGRLLLRLLAEAGAGSIAGWRVLDLGAGFGALALYCASLGAEVVAVDSNAQRMQVALTIAQQRGLAVSALAARAQSLPLPDASFDLVIANNSLYFIADEREHQLALSEIRRVLRPGGWLVMCNPNRLHPRDQFTGLPLLGLLPPALAQQVAESRGHHRPDVRLSSPGGAVRQLRRAGFTHARWRAQPQHGLGARFAGHHHVIARRPAAPEDRGLRRRIMPSERFAADAREALRVMMAATRRVPGVLVALAGVTLVWTQCLGLEQSLWGDELYSIVTRIEPGPAGIFRHYIPNDHMLFALLAWASTAISGDRSAAAYRLWSVAPAIAGAALMTWWLWRRLDRWVAAVFAVLVAASPMYLDLGSEARGYGLGFLAGAVMVIGADRFAWTRSRGALALFAAGGLLGIWTLPVIVLPFLGVASVLMAHPALRRRVLVAVTLVGAASLIFYLPVLGGVISSSGQQYGALLPWYAVLTGPVRDLLAPSVSLVLGNVAVGVGEAIAAALLIVGLAALWRRPERLLALLLVAPAVFTYLALKLLGFYVVDNFDSHAVLSLLALRDRFTSYLLLPLLAGMAVGLVELGRSLARGPVRALAVGACAVTLSLFALGQLDSLARHNAAVPLESYKEVGAIVRGTGIALTVTNRASRLGLRYYTGGKPKILTPVALDAMFCSAQTGFIYVEHLLAPQRVDTSCLVRRGATEIRVPERRGTPMTVYILPKTA